jgi:hypothetical protein
MLPLFRRCNCDVIILTGDSSISLIEVFENPVDRIWNSTTGRPPYSDFKAYVLPDRYSGICILDYVQLQFI